MPGELEPFPVAGPTQQVEQFHHQAVRRREGEDFPGEGEQRGGEVELDKSLALGGGEGEGRVEEVLDAPDAGRVRD